MEAESAIQMLQHMARDYLLSHEEPADTYVMVISQDIQQMTINETGVTPQMVRGMSVFVEPTCPNGTVYVFEREHVFPKD
tara:strand:+ start:43 stop:282 length:240 start_codon:yes stop_codon:yes gene_type:complete